MSGSQGIQVHHARLDLHSPASTPDHHQPQNKGKWRGAVKLDTNVMAPMEKGEEEGEIITRMNATDVSAIKPELHIFDLYAVRPTPEQIIQPFVHQLNIRADGGEVMRVQANFDDGALANAMSVTKFNSIKHRLGRYELSSRLLRMANGTIIRPAATWHGKMEIEGVHLHGSFEVFESRGNWEFLFGKPLLAAFHAIHDYLTDTVTIENRGLMATLKNQVNHIKGRAKARQISGRKEQGDTLGDNETKEVSANSRNEMTAVYSTTDEPEDNNSALFEIEVNPLDDDKGVFTRFTDPWKKEQVEEILKQVTIGPDLSDEEHGRVTTFLAEWADVFALSVSKVKHVEGAIHHLDIPVGTKFSKKVNQKALTPPQRKYLYDSVDAMLKADIIEQCPPDQVKCVSPTTLAQKTHTGSGLMLEELQHRVNDECTLHGFDPIFCLPPRTSPTPNDEDKGEPKWRICQNFSQINKVTKVALMPQGDIRAKQQHLSGHRWVSGFDFAAGFYVIAVDPESRPYTAFYVEGRGYFQYKRMPFGLTGTQSTFTHMTATRMHELIVEEIMELFVNDGGAAADTFEEMIEKN